MSLGEKSMRGMSVYDMPLFFYPHTLCTTGDMSCVFCCDVRCT